MAKIGSTVSLPWPISAYGHRVSDLQHLDAMLSLPGDGSIHFARSHLTPLNWLGSTSSTRM